MDPRVLKRSCRLLCVSWIIVGHLCTLGNTVYRGECRSEGYFKSVMNDSRLKDYVISTQDVRSLPDCVIACLDEKNCSSYNFQVSGDPLHRCELNSKTKSTARPWSLVREDGYQYYEAIGSLKGNNVPKAFSSETKDLCEAASCLNGGTCREDICQCASSYTGKSCEILKTGSFLLSYDMNATSDYTSVSVKGNAFTTHLAVYVWLKPMSSEGVVFSYATTTNPREMVLLFNQTNVILHLGGEVMVFDIILPLDKWSHLSFDLKYKTELIFYYNGFAFEVKNTTIKSPHGITIEETGVLVPAFEQTSPGNVAVNTRSNLTITRLFLLDDNSGFSVFELVGVVNEPKFSRSVPEPFRVDWKDFYRSHSNSSNSVFISPSDEPDIGNYDLKFHNAPDIEIKIADVLPMKALVLAMWLRVTTVTDARIFGLGSDDRAIVVLRQNATDHGLRFKIHSDKPREISNVITNTRWFHLLWHWESETGTLLLYKNGNLFNDGFSGVLLNGEVPEILNAKVRIGDSKLDADITSLNLWSFSLTKKVIITLALNPGNIAGDIFSWKMVQETAGVVVSSPSKCHNRPGQFDLIFPNKSKDSLNMNYILLKSLYTEDMDELAVAFWIKIPSLADEFTLISSAVATQLNEFNVHFNTTEMSVVIQGQKSSVFLPLSSLTEDWQHFMIVYSSTQDSLQVFHNGHSILDNVVPGGPITTNNGFLVIGAKQNTYNSTAQLKYQFIGELSLLQIYRRTFPARMIAAFARRCWNNPGDFVEWADLRLLVVGQVETRNPSECMEIKNGES